MYHRRTVDKMFAKCTNVRFKKTETHLLLYTVANVYPFFWIRLYESFRTYFLPFYHFKDLTGKQLTIFTNLTPQKKHVQKRQRVVNTCVKIKVLFHSNSISESVVFGRSVNPLQTRAWGGGAGYAHHITPLRFLDLPTIISSDSCQAVIRLSSSSHQAVIRLS